MDLDMKIDDKAAKVLFRNLGDKAKDLASPMRKIANQLHNSIQENFDVGGRYSSPGSIMGGPNQWEKTKRPPLYSSGKAKGKEKGRTLVRAGHLQRAITEDSDDGSAWVTAHMAYAAIHNYGGKTEPHEIRARNGKSLAFGMGGKTVLRKSVHHPGSDIPARPFMVIQEEDLDYARETLLDHLTEDLD